MITIQEARRLVVEAATPRTDPGERLPLVSAVGRRLLAAVTADGDLPPFDRVMMDGFAVRAAETGDGVRLPVDGETAAGDPSDTALPIGMARAIMTGAALPAGADAVIQVEWTSREDDAMVMERGVRSGQNVAPRGEDLSAGTVVAQPGHLIDAMSLSLLIASGVGEVVVRRRPSVALLTSGDELVPPGTPIRRGQIRESNGPALAALLARTGADVHDLGIVRDDRDALLTAVGEAATRDVVVLTGGSSVGAYDYSAEVVEALGGELCFDRVAVKPGKPTLFYTRENTLIFCLPGNPVAALMTGRVLVAAALARLGGAPVSPWPETTAPLTGPVRRNPARDLLVPARREGDRVAFDGWHGSGDLVCMARADHFAHVARGEGEAPADTPATLFAVDGRDGW